VSERVILASASVARRRLLEAAGLIFETSPSKVDEEEVKAGLREEGADALDAAETLAELKALKVSRRQGAALVIGADQMLECGGVWFDKPGSAEAVAGHLDRLAGRRHRLATAVVVCRDGERIWHHRAEAWLTMRRLSPQFVADYVAAVGSEVAASVGAYQLEGRGAQLFTAVEGDHFVVQGLPLLPLLGFLRDRGVLQA